jgi:histidinol-phosphate aminotransferase
LKALDHVDEVNTMIKETVKERDVLGKELAQIPFVQNIYPSDANFVLAKMTEANAVYNFLKERGIVVRNRSNVILCEDCLRITVGTPDENQQLIQVMMSYN